MKGYVDVKISRSLEIFTHVHQEGVYKWRNNNLVEVILDGNISLSRHEIRIIIWLVINQCFNFLETETATILMIPRNNLLSSL